MKKLTRCFLLALACALAGAGGLRAHPAQFTTFQITVGDDGHFQARLNLDLLAYALGMPSTQARDTELIALLDGPRQALAEKLADANDRFHRETVLRTDRGDVAVPAAGWTQPDIATVEAVLKRGIIPRTVVPGDIAFTGVLPAGAHTLAVRLPYVVGETVHVYELPGGRTESAPVAAGDYGPEIALPASEPTPSSGAKLLRYVVVGFHHIIPEGTDHILFVLGLFLFSARLGPLLWQVSAFTVAHSITLGLALYGVVRLPSAVTEPLIAASIVFVAVENIFTKRLRPWRYAVVFVFGLIHGMGFASAFAEVGLPRQDFLVGLVGFNLGVEGGQLAVIASAFLAVGWFRHRPWYRRVIVIPASLAIALVAAYWTVTRII